MTDVSAFDGPGTSVTLSTGAAMPRLGLGTWQSPANVVTVGAVATALELGYRHVDTASMYRNEAEVGMGVRQSGLPRSEVFVVTKVWNSQQGYEATVAACEASLTRLGMDYVDLYLVHWPVPPKAADTWRAMELLHSQGRARAIGVSNYEISHLEAMESYAEIPAAVNQFELNPFMYKSRRELVAYCRDRGVAITAYRPLAGGSLGNTRIAEVATRHGTTSAQVMLRWALQHDFIVIPKSVRRERLIENAGAFDFELSSEEMVEIDALG